MIAESELIRFLEDKLRHHEPPGGRMEPDRSPASHGGQNTEIRQTEIPAELEALHSSIEHIHQQLARLEDRLVAVRAGADEAPENVPAEPVMRTSLGGSLRDARKAAGRAANRVSHLLDDIEL